MECVSRGVCVGITIGRGRGKFRTLGELLQHRFQDGFVLRVDVLNTLLVGEGELGCGRGQSGDGGVLAACPVCPALSFSYQLESTGDEARGLTH